ncbi:MAG: hypothetical protein IPN76_18400 [Saprospiraceae bacterium]|nr:hypothetical protein [Saprospiraceae bacterium]
MENTFTTKLRYRGRLRTPAEVHALIHETEDICRTNGWKYHLWDKDWAKPASLHMEASDKGLNFKGHAPLKGINFSVGQSESVWLTFTPDGILHSLMTLAEPDFTGDDVDMPWERVKTCYDGPATHLALCKLFRYLADKYFDVFEVMDESGYWAHGDDARFTNWLEDIVRSFQQFQAELDALAEDDSLSPSEHRKRMRQLLDGYGDKFRVGE